MVRTVNKFEEIMTDQKGLPFEVSKRDFEVSLRELLMFMTMTGWMG